MSYFIKNKQDLKNVSKLLEEIREDKMTETILKNSMDLFIPKDSNNHPCTKSSIVNFKVGPAVFNPRTNCILLNKKSFNNWLNQNAGAFYEDNKKYKREDLDAYFTLFALAHESAHAIEYLIGQNKIDCNSQVLQKSYKGLYYLFTFKDHFIKTPGDYKKRLSLFLYRIRENYFVLERNANIEAFDLLSKVAEYEQKESIYNLFEELKLLMCTIGYHDNENGSLEETYRKILMHRKYKSFYQKENLDIIDKIRYGLPIPNESKQELFQKVKKLNK